METFIIYFKLNRAKINDNSWSIKLQNVSDYIIKRKNLNVKSLCLHFAEINNDFVENKITLKITYNLIQL